MRVYLQWKYVVDRTDFLFSRVDLNKRVMEVVWNIKNSYQSEQMNEMIRLNAEIFSNTTSAFLSIRFSCSEFPCWFTIERQNLKPNDFVFNNTANTMLPYQNYSEWRISRWWLASPPPCLHGTPSLKPSSHTRNCPHQQQYKNQVLMCNEFPWRILETRDQCQYRSGMVNSKSFISKVLLRIKWKFELTYAL